MSLPSVRLYLCLIFELYAVSQARFDAKTAKTISDAIHEVFTTNERYHQRGKAGIAYSITLFNGLTLQAGIVGNGVSPDNQEWLRRKTNTVKRFGCSSWLRGQSRVLKGKLPDDPLLGPDFAVSVSESDWQISQICVNFLRRLTVGLCSTDLYRPMEELSQFASG